MPSRTSSAADLWQTIAADAERESPLWGEALRPEGERERVAIFSSLGEGRFALGIETIYEGYLLHYGRSRLFTPPDGDVALLLGDYLYAHGLVRISALGEVVAVGDLAELISLCAHLRTEGTEGDGAAWAATAALLGQGALGGARRALRDDGDAGALARLARGEVGGELLERALASHARQVG